MTDLFSDSKSTKQYLHIVKDGNVIEAKPEQLFDAQLFNELYAVSYVSSPKFFSRIVKKFQQVHFILGIGDNEVLNDFAQRVTDFLDPQKRLDFWNDMEDNVREQIQANKFQIRYAIPFGDNKSVIHSKIYLLRHSTTNVTRVMLGSANLTENAFVRAGQFEELLVFDNNQSLFDIYFKRFNALFEETQDFVPDVIKNNVKPTVIIASDPEMLKNVLMDITESVRPQFIITEDEKKMLEQVPIELDYHKTEAIRTNNVFEVLLKKKNDHYLLNSKADLIKKYVPIKTLVSRTHKKTAQIDNRLGLYFIDAEQTLYYGDRGTNQLQKFSKSLDVEHIKSSLRNIVSFVDAYDRFTHNPTSMNQSKVFEIILYAFISPFIWKMRSDFALQEGRESVKRYFQPFLVIGGKAGAGKTTILEYVSLLIGGNQEDKYLSYNKVDKTGIIYDFFHSDNLYPIKIDEMPINFFKSADSKKGESLIKYIANELSGKHPVLLSTTNLSDFNVNSQILTRVYYLEIDKVFKKELFSESSKYLNELLSSTDDNLFQDFTARFSQLIAEKSPFYAVDDMLIAGRMIFKDYFAESDMPLPIWFPQKMFKDYEERGKTLWRNLYLVKEDAFKKIDTGETLFVELEKLCELKQRASFINYLDPSCIQEDGTILVLWRKQFLKFIDSSGDEAPTEAEKEILMNEVQEIAEELFMKTNESTSFWERLKFW